MGTERIMRRFRIGIAPLGILIVTCWGMSAFAEEPPASLALDEMVVTATKTEAKIEDVPASITVTTKDEIKEKSAERLRDVLKLLDPSVNFQRSRGRGMISIRGMNSQHTLLLIDGRRFAGEVDQEFELDRLTLENVERIEILKGPASALYGTDALGGVINIITKAPPDKPSFVVRPRYGGFFDGDRAEHKSLTWHMGAKGGAFGITLSGTYVNMEPYGTKEHTTLQSDTDRLNLAFKVTYDLTEFTRLTFDNAYVTEDIEDITLAGPSFTKDIHDNQRKDFSLGLSHTSPDLDYLIRAYRSTYDKDYELRTLSTNALGRFDVARPELSVVEGRITKEVLKGHRLTFGVEYRHYDYEGTRLNTGNATFTKTRDGLTLTGSEAKLNYYAGYIQHEWQATENLLFIPALRYDDNNKFESEWSPKVGITYKFLPNLRAKANYGHGFKTPTPRELFIEFRQPSVRYIVQGNPAVKAEKSDSYEIALEGEKGIFSGRVAYFYNDVTDLIESVETVPPPTGTPSGWRVYSYENIGKAEIQGVEIGATASVTEELSLRAGYTWLDAEDEEKHQRLLMRPRHKVTTGAAYDNQALGLRANLWGEYYGDNLWERAIPATATTPAIPKKVKDYSLWYLSFSKDITKNLELYAGVDNLFNHKDKDLPTMGAFFYSGVRVKY